MYLVVNNLYGYATSQKLPVNGFKLKTSVSTFDEEFIKICDENVDKRYILEVEDIFVTIGNLSIDLLKFFLISFGMCSTPKLSKYVIKVC